MVFGTLTTLDILADNTTTVAQFGEQALVDAVRQASDLYNQAMQESVADFAVITSAAQLPYGTGGAMKMQRLDQFGSPDTQKIPAAGSLGIPLWLTGIAVQWNRHYVLNSRVNELLAQLDSAANADKREINLDFYRRLFTPTNTTGFYDSLETKLTYNLQALLNADSMAIPPGPTGTTFNAATHTHYLATASLTAASLTALIDTVVEHGVTGGMVVYINRAQEAAVRAMTGAGEFVAYVDARINPAVTATTANGALDVTNPADRAIGIFAGAEVWVKPLIPANYQLAFDRGAGSDKALAIRTRSGTLAGDPYQGGFGLFYEDDVHPLRARALGREYGVGVNSRHKAAVAYSANAVYATPVFS